MLKEMYFLAVETSCDDTSVSVLRAEEDGRGRLKKIEALSNVVSSQTELHAGYGGVYPFLAKREHQKNLPAVFENAAKNFDLSKLKFIAVTQGPGLDPCLWMGINFAQDLAKKYNLPLVGANHLEAHFLANLITLGIGEDEFAKNYLPAVCLVVSGGHTLLFLATGIGDYQLLGQTVDDAAGECFDKAARILGLGYPGGPEIAKYAAYHSVEVKPPLPPLDLLKRRFSGGLTSTTSTTSEPLLVKLPRPMMRQKNYNFSFSGLKTAILYFHQKQAEEIKKSPEYLQAMSYGIQQAIAEVLVFKTMRAAVEFDVKSIIIGGGVSANRALRSEFKKKIEESKKKFKFLAPAADLSVDNAAMAGAAGYFAFRRGETVSPDKLESQPNLGI